ncbi:MAG: PspC domain-containing protein, partial [Paludibacteraceae bacterium]|nr:PspC domain-containing protein [Paludibacteraceae bacterium]
MEKKLTKSNDKKIAGICAGFAEYLGWDVTLTRALYAIATILLAAFPG